MWANWAITSYGYLTLSSSILTTGLMKQLRSCSLKSRRMVPSQPRLDVGMLKDEREAEEFVTRLSGDLGVLGALWDPEELWSAFKTTILDVADGCLGIH